MRKSDTAHQSYNHDAGQPARQQSHDDHTGRDPRIAHDGHGCYDRKQWDVSVAPLVHAFATEPQRAACCGGMHMQSVLMAPSGKKGGTIWWGGRGGPYVGGEGVPFPPPPRPMLQGPSGAGEGGPLLSCCKAIISVVARRGGPPPPRLLLETDRARPCVRF